MNWQGKALEPGLYFVATPIGAARDITLRALDILAAADVLAAEDTRSLRRLLEIHGIALAGRPLVAYHDHSAAPVRARLVTAIAEGRAVAYASEAGMPLVADPGYALGRAVTAAGHMVTVAPGPSAALAALAISGLPSDAFFFAGFAPSAQGARRARLEALRDVPGTLIFFEAPRRVAAFLRDAADCLGADRDAALCREITKKFEEVKRGTLGTLAQELADADLKGEVVLLIARKAAESVSDVDLDAALGAALARMSLKDAVDAVAKAHALPRRRVYQRALDLRDSQA